MITTSVLQPNSTDDVNRYLVEVGLANVIAEIGVRPLGSEVTLDRIALRVGMREDRARGFAIAAGLSPDEEHGSRWFDSDITLFKTIQSTASVLGDGAVLALLRRAGAAMAQLAHASSAAFRVKTNLSAFGLEVDDASRLQHQVAVRELIDGFTVVLGQLLRHHYLGAIRTRVPRAGNHGELREMCVGFVDLSSSAELGSRVTMNELAELMTEFEAESFHAATVRGARVVKTIGDEVMLCADEPDPVCRTALDLVEYFGRHQRFRSARAGVTFGEVIDQDGDCYGPVVNCAARLVEAAEDGTVMAEKSVVGRIGSSLRYVSYPTREHRGVGTIGWGRVVEHGSEVAGRC